MSAARGMLSRVVADAALAPHEQHGQRQAAAEGHGIVPGAAGQMAHPQADAFDPVGEQLHQAGVAGRCRRIVREGHLGGDVPLRGDARDRRLDVGHGRCALCIERCAHVEGELDLAGNGVAGRVGQAQPPDRCDQICLTLRARLDGEHHLGRRRQRIAAPMHGHGAGVAGLARDLDHASCGAADGGDDADGQVVGFEHRSLLDVHLDVAERRCCAACLAGDGCRDRSRMRQGPGGAIRPARRAHRGRPGRRCRQARASRPARTESARLPRRRTRPPRWRTGRPPAVPPARRRRRCRSGRRGIRRTAGVAHRVDVRPDQERGRVAVPNPSLRPTTLPVASMRTLMPASRIHCATRSAARLCAGLR